MTTTLGNLIMKNEFESASNMTYPRSIISALNRMRNLTMDDEFESASNMTYPRNITSALNRTTLRNLTMNDEFESTTKTVQGYDTCSPVEEIKTALKYHFSSCGEIISVCIPSDPEDPNLNTNRYASIYILGEGAERKAMNLHGSFMGGYHHLFVLPHKEAARMAQANRLFMCKKVCVQGFDHSLPKSDVRSALTNHFSSCGEIVKVKFAPCSAPISDPDTFAIIFIEGGEDAEEKALQLNDSDMGGGCKLVVTSLYPTVNTTRSYNYDDDIPLGYTLPFPLIPKKKKKTKKNKKKYHT